MAGRHVLRFGLCAAGVLLNAGPARSGEVFAGLAAHDVDLGMTRCCYEGGVDLQFGIRSRPLGMILGSEARAYAFGSINSEGGVSFAASGLMLRWPLGKSRLYIQPGLGVAVHDGPGADYQRAPDRLYLGSRVLFEPELSLGWHLAERWSAEIGYVHLSHARLSGRQNPGLDDIGLRLLFRFGS